MTKTKSEIKAFYETGDKPTESNFGEFIDSTIFLPEDASAGNPLVGVVKVSGDDSTGIPTGTLGEIILTAEATASAQGHLGARAVGVQLFEAETTASAVSQLDIAALVSGGITHSPFGIAMASAASTAAGQLVMGAGAVGVTLFTAITSASAHSVMGLVINVDVQSHVMTTQGDMVRGGASGAPERVAIGAADKILRSDGADTDYTTEALTRNGHLTNSYYSAGGHLTSTATLVVTADRMYFRPFLVISSATFTRLVLEVTVGAGSLGRMGIYEFANGVPGALILDAGTFDSSGAAVLEATISWAAKPGIYAAVAVFDNTPTVRAAGQVHYDILSHNSSPWANADETGGYRTFTFAALPDPFGSVTARLAAGNSGIIPSFSIRVV